jgi:hypothetical protein
LTDLKTPEDFDRFSDGLNLLYVCCTRAKRVLRIPSLLVEMLRKRWGHEGRFALSLKQRCRSGCDCSCSLPHPDPDLPLSVVHYAGWFSPCNKGTEAETEARRGFWELNYG